MKSEIDTIHSLQASTIQDTLFTVHTVQLQLYIFVQIVDLSMYYAEAKHIQGANVVKKTVVTCKKRKIPSAKGLPLLMPNK